MMLRLSGLIGDGVQIDNVIPFYDLLKVDFNPLNGDCPSRPVVLKANVINGSRDVALEYGVPQGSGKFVSASDVATSQILAVSGIGFNEFMLIVY